ncbi:unnamed protein product [Polarella glacialis]|uniref:Uncharacterized protein n=1 Tax=Polarella glacialis TaxID=89957 RepID=A0A813FXG0_POLGL|nr:unnamed protein product [Polarella glacialis]CAE8644177.1 unnamed protein product [Polarella glacialis]
MAEILHCYVALNQADAEFIDGSGVLDPQLFGSRCHVPLDQSPEAAIERSLHDKTTTAVQAATDTTNWRLLKVTLSSEQVSRAFQSGYLHWSSGMKNLEWWGKLQLRSEGAPGLLLTTEWIQHPLNALGLSAWGNSILGAVSNDSGTCGGCQEKAVPVWQSGAEFAKEEYCAKCWNQFFMQCSKRSLHENTWDGASAQAVSSEGGA